MVTALAAAVAYGGSSVQAQQLHEPILPTFDMPSLEIPQAPTIPQSSNPRYRACKQDLTPRARSDNPSPTAFLHTYLERTTEGASCIFENTYGHASFFDTSIVDIYQGKYEELSLAIQKSIEKVEKKGRVDTDVARSFGQYITDEVTILRQLEGYAICKASEAVNSHMKTDFGCDDKGIVEGIQSRKKFHEEWKSHMKKIFGKLPKNFPHTDLNITNSAQLIALVKSRQYKAIELGYTIGKVKVANARPDIMMQHDKEDKQAEVAAIERRLAEINEEIEKIKEAGRKKLAEETKRLKPFKDALDAALNPEKSNAKPTARQRLRAHRIQRATKGVARLAKAVANLEDQLSRTSQAAVRRRQQIELQLSNVRLEMLETQAKLDEDLKDQSADDVKSGAKIDRKAYIKAKDAYETERRQSEGRFMDLEGKLTDKEKIQRGYLDDLARLNGEIAEASVNLALDAARERAVLEQISTDDAIVYFNFDFRQLNELNKALAETSDALKNATERREDARQKMKDAVQHADNAGNALSLATYASYLSQASLEALSQIKDVAEAGAKGGPGAALAEALHKIAFNSLDYAVGGGTKVYDSAQEDWNPITGTQTREEFFKSQASSLAQRFSAKMYDGKPIESGTVHVAKVAGNYLKRGIQMDLQELKLEKLAEDAFAKTGNSPSLSASLKKQFRKEVSGLSSSRQKWTDQTMRNGVGGFTKRFLGDQAKSHVKGFAIDILKKELGQLLQGGAMRDYLDAQVAVAQSVETFRRFGDMYWGRKAVHDLLTARRKELLKNLELRTDDQIVLKRNDDFIPEAGYRFSLFFTGKDIGEQIEADVWVAGKRLTKGKIPNTYEMTAELADHLNNNDLPSELPLRVKIK